MSGKKLYLVSVALGPTWKENIFTYHSDTNIELGTVVKVPFGNSEKLGLVIKKVENSTIETKKLSLIEPNVRLPETSINLQQWMNKAYPNMMGYNTQLLLPKFINESRLYFKKLEPNNDPKAELPPLSKLQREALHKLEKDTKPSVLHGITGSGKTRIYQELTKKTINKGKNALILYPEISLTTHIKNAFKDVVDENNLHTYHSRSTPKEQREAWFSAINSKDGGQVFIGPRSALFLPINNLGLIIIDEAHDPSFKQDTGNHYNGLMVAGALAKLANAKLILGSATPPVQETYFIEKRGGSIVCMHELAKESSFAKTYTVIDMSNKDNIRSGSYLISKNLYDSLESTLSNGGQSLLFLNRRGTARSVVCSNCGWHAECRKCSSATTYHHDINRYVCHVCGTKQPIVTSCPECGAILSLKSPGIKALESEIQKLFPSAKIMRFDSDNKKSESVAENYTKIRDGKVDIIIGTQLITKGLDLPNLSTVGIIKADSALLLPDYSSTERSFQQLTQVSGRTGRGHRDGKIIIQTYSPSSKILDLVKKQDWHSFYKEELKQRENSKFPPYSFLLKVWSVKKTDKSAQSAALKLFNSLSDIKNIKILGPAPSFYPKTAGKFSWQILVFSKNRSILSEVVSELPKDLHYDLDPVSLL